MPHQRHAAGRRQLPGDAQDFNQLVQGETQLAQESYESAGSAFAKVVVTAGDPGARAGGSGAMTYFMAG